MQVNTHLFGPVEVDPERIITFPEGLLAFEACKRFMLVHESDQGEPSSYTLQSLDDPALALQIADPTAMGLNYELALTDTETALLQTPAVDDVAVMIVLYKRENPEAAGIAANIRAPLVINTRARVGLQKVMAQVRPNITLSNLASPLPAG